MTNLKEINKRLKLYGADANGKPRFRLVWSEDVLENVMGTHREYKDGIFLREWHGVRKMPKFALMGVSEKYVLEVLVDTPNNHEIPEDSDFYEPVYIFQDANKKFLVPLWSVIEDVVYCWHHRKDREQIQARLRWRAQKQKESFEKTYEMLFKDSADTTGANADAFAQKSAILLPGKDF